MRISRPVIMRIDAALTRVGSMRNVVPSNEGMDAHSLELLRRHVSEAKRLIDMAVASATAEATKKIKPLY